MAPRQRSRIRKKQMQSNNEEFIAALTGKYATLMKQLGALKNERIALLKKTLEFARIQIPKAIRDMTLRELKEIEKREECVPLVNKRKRVRFSAVVEERSLKRPRGRPRFEDYGPPKRPNMDIPLTKCLKAPSPLPRPQETKCRGVGGAEALTVVPKGGSLARAALAVLRVPRRGELAVSAAGSPLLAAATAAGDAPSVLVPLRSGDVVSLQATAHTPAATDVAGALAKGLDSAVRVQLRSLASTLRAALDACGDGEAGEGGGGGGTAGSTPLSGESAATPGRGYGELDSALRQALGDAGDAPRPPDSTPRRLPARSRIPTRKRL